MKTTPKFTSRKFPKGEYLVCDPCYPYPKGEWQEFCKSLSDIPGVLEYDGLQFFVWGTAFGDGMYPLVGPKDVEGTLGVDAGLLSIIPKALIEKWGAMEKMADYEKRGLVAWAKMKRAFEVREDQGDAFFGGYGVLTSALLDDDEDDEGSED